MGHAGISGNQVRALEDSFSIVIMLVVYFIPFVFLYCPLSAMQTWNSLLNRSAVFTDGVKSRLFHFQTGAVIVYIHVHNLSVSGFELPFGAEQIFTAR